MDIAVGRGLSPVSDSGGRSIEARDLRCARQISAELFHHAALAPGGYAPDDDRLVELQVLGEAATLNPALRST
jgi:hypothetical protein